MSGTTLQKSDLTTALHVTDRDVNTPAVPANSNLHAIRRLPFFEGAADQVLHRFASQAHWRSYAAGEVVVDLGDSTNDVFFILDGNARVVLRTVFGYEAILNDLRTGDFFGELAAIDGVRRSANVTALTHTRVCVVSAAVFMETVISSPEIGQRLLRLLTKRLRVKDERLIELGALSVRQRLIAELLRLSRDRGAGERVLSPPPPQHELAHRIGTRRESVSRELAEMARAGLLTVGRRAIVLHSPDKLRDEVEARLQGTGGAGSDGK